MSRAGDDRTPGQRVLYRVCRQIVYWAFTLVYRARLDGVRRLPTGGVLLVANHQSHLDPPLVGLCADRPLEYLARAGLFKNRLFAWLITGLGARPIDETGSDAGSGLRTALDRLHAGQALLVFPEGSRTPDGAMHSFKRGAILLVRRAGVPVVPVAIEGTFDAWPRRRPLPRLLGQRVRVRFGAPLDPEALLRDGPEGAVRHLETQIDTMRLELRAQLRRASAGRFPAPGPGDRPRSA
ncbi:MAG: lysophospholipid acyltransferase family protein [Phycisphaerales bacterium JB039]